MMTIYMYGSCSQDFYEKLCRDASYLYYRTSSKNSTLLIIWHPLPNDGKQSLIIRQRSSRAYMLYMGIECARGRNVEY